MRAERFTALLYRQRWTLLALTTVHAFVLHYFVIGFPSWDGFTYRLPPVVELVQHGDFGMTRFNQWAFVGHLPFLELANLPFLYVFKLRGLYIGVPLVVYPLCVYAVYACGRELTGDPRSATFGAIAYAALPMVNQQPYAGYIDFILAALIAYFVYAVLRLRTTTRPGWSFVRVVVATVLVTMSRVHALYIVVVLTPCLIYPSFCQRTRWRVTVADRRGLWRALAAIALGAAPMIALQIYRFVHYGTPTYPLQFAVLGITIGNGKPALEHMRAGGVHDGSLLELGRAAIRGWIWLGRWPKIGFFDSREQGGGFVAWVAAPLLPTFVRRATRVERWLVVGCVVVSVLAHDFAIPRYAYTLVVALVVVIGRAMPALLEGGRRHRALFWFASVVLLAHGCRPEVDLLAIHRGGFSPRLNIASSPYADQTFVPFPDIHGRFVIIDGVAEGMVLPIYGADLDNEILETVPADALGARCAGLAAVLAREPTALFIDDKDETRDCQRTCQFTTTTGACRAYRIVPP
ncbi:MAG: hypothetical protein K8W52_10315 [Deltaproteobacteria bacterium]|nr:hypothetical protein [Deltaproteobacteria bacterium]